MIIGNKGNGSLGDCLWITSVFRYIKAGKVVLHNDEQCRAVGRIFDNICEVEYSHSPPERPDNITHLSTELYTSSHRSKKILLACGITNNVSVPFVKINNSETAWAKDFLKKYKNPIVAINDNSGSGDPSNFRAAYVRPPVDKLQSLVNKLVNKNHTVLQFGRIENSKFTPLSHCEHIRGLSIRQTAACYSVIQQYIGGDTGDYHLMLAVGGTAVVLIPDESIQFGYVYNDLLYKDINFENNMRRVNYLNFNKIK
jgi:ADP-heptose:LPS heptosyltransferase